MKLATRPEKGDRSHEGQRSLSSKRVLATASALSLAVGAGGAIAASKDSSDRGEGFLARVAGHLGISTEKLEDATKAAAIDQVDADFKAGRITKAQADELKAGSGRGTRRSSSAGLTGSAAADGPRLHHAPFGHLSAAADYLGLSVPTLLEQLSSGKSLAQVAKAQDKSVDGLKKAMVADAKKRLDQAVEDGMLTEAQAKEALSAIESRIDALVNGNLRFRERHDFRGAADRRTRDLRRRLVLRRPPKTSPLLSLPIERARPAGLFRSEST